MKIDKSKITVLIVDDTPENIYILGEYLSDYKIKVAINGKQALEILNSGILPNIVLLDIMMPEIDGYEVCRRIKEDPLTKDIPVIFISSLSEIPDKVKGFQIGAIDYITKPFQLEEVKSRIETHVSLSLYQRELENINNVLEQKVKERTHELLLSKDKAEEASRLKSHFLSLMSHELRTPMVGILGYSEVLIEEIESPELNSFAKNLYESANRLKETLESILILSKLESETQAVNPSLFNLTKRIDDLIKSHKLCAFTKGINVILKNNLKCEEIILDQIVFDIIFNNLLSNAVKYTEEGSVTVELFDEIVDKENYIYLKVIDTGIGIPEDKHSIIFEEFRQVQEGMKRNFEGVGLGLSLVKKYVERLGGTIQLVSTEGQGSTFTVKLKSWDKIQLIQKTEIKDAIGRIKDLGKTKSKPRVLVVEDDRINVEVTKLFLNDIVELDVAVDGSTAIQMAKNNDYAAILMDINLGKGLSGIDVTKIIKQFENYKETPIIAYTAFAMDGDEKSFLEQGCTHYMPKPYSKKDLLELIKNVI